MANLARQGKVESSYVVLLISPRIGPILTFMLEGQTRLCRISTSLYTRELLSLKSFQIYQDKNDYFM